MLRKREITHKLIHKNINEIIKIFFSFFCVFTAAGTHLEGDRQRLVAPPVGGQDGAEEVGAVGAHQLGRVVGDDLGHAAVLVGPQPRDRRVRLPDGGAHVVHSPWDRLEAAGRRTEPPAGARIYGNAHHNNREVIFKKQKLLRLQIWKLFRGRL